jgi:spermidine synthase
MKWSGRNWVFLLLFFGSGAAALVYEVVWSKFLSQMFGSTIYAQTVVLAVFMGGLALGNALVGKISDRLGNQAKAYGYLELLIGIYAFFFASIYGFADRAFIAAGSKILEHSVLLLALKGMLALALLIAPTVFMGGTLPLLAAWLQKHSDDAGRNSARFYAINSLGAVFGAALAGFYLVRQWGLVASLQWAAMVNLLIGATAIILSRNDEETPSSATPTVGPTESPNTFRWATLLVALTGGVSMGLEVLASRALAMIFGSSLQSFAIVLIAFILGIGLGSTVISSRKLGGRNETWIAGLLVAAAVWVGFLVFNIEAWAHFYRLGRTGLANTETGYFFHQFFMTFLSVVVLGVPAALIGAVLPLLIRVIAGEAKTLGAQVGRLLTWNTLGAVGGVLLTGFVLMPQCGLRNSFVILALGLVAGAIIVSWRKRLFVPTGFAGVAAVLLCLLFVLGDTGWRHVMVSGVFRLRDAAINPELMKIRKKHLKLLFYEDAADATVSVEQGDGIRADEAVGLRVNGKPDASSKSDLCTQMLVSHLPLLAKPDSKQVFLLGLGSGISAGAIATHPIDHLTVGENCEPVIRAARHFAQWNRRVYENPKVRIWTEDARTILKLSPQKYDVIITQPSNPWTAGNGSVFSREFYELAKRRLTAGGIVAQWFHMYEMHDGIVALVLRTFNQVFPHLEIWDCGNGDIIMLGALESWPSSPEVYRTAFEREEVRKDLEKIGITSPEALWVRQLASQRTAFAIAGDGPIQTDWLPVLEYEAPKAFYIGKTAEMLNDFDERTKQYRNAPAEKRSVLTSLSDESVRQVFSKYGTINGDLYKFLRWRLSSEKLIEEYKREFNAESLPCIFRIRPDPDTANGDTTEDIRTLHTAKSLIENESRFEEGVLTIQSLLMNYRPGTKWSAASYAAYAAETCLNEGNLNRARTFVQLGLKHNPRDGQLNFLERLLSRDEIAQTSVLHAAR